MSFGHFILTSSLPRISPKTSYIASAPVSESRNCLARGTIDEDVMRVLEGKADRQNAVIEAVKARL